MPRYQKDEQDMDDLNEEEDYEDDEEDEEDDDEEESEADELIRQAWGYADQPKRGREHQERISDDSNYDIYS